MHDVSKRGRDASAHEELDRWQSQPVEDDDATSLDLHRLNCSSHLRSTRRHRLARRYRISAAPRRSPER